MKGFRKILVLVIIAYAAIVAVLNVNYQKFVTNQHTERYMVMNRIHDTIQSEIQPKKTVLYAGDELADESLLEKEDITSDIIQSTSEMVVTNIWNENKVAWQTVFEEDMVPQEVSFIPIQETQTQLVSVIEMNCESYIWNLYGADGNLLGFVEYRYTDDFVWKNQLVLNVALVAGFLFAICVLGYVERKILKPFQSLVTYPEKLSKGMTEEKLPETKNRYFGKFVWGMNMLADQLTTDRKRLQKLEYERQTMVTSIAHGVKTPVANIKLYANAIETGLYQESGVVNPKDAEIAGKIEKNAMEIETLVSEMITTTSTSLCDFEPKLQVFYMKELEEQIEEAFANRLRTKQIPFRLECDGNPMVNSDKEGLCKILSQFIENAIKYGDGTGITVSLDKQEDGYYFSVKNKGELLLESEIPFIFKSFWRGSNVGNAEGSGIGLFVAKEMAKKLGGDIYVKRHEDSGEMEFMVYLEN